MRQRLVQAHRWLSREVPWKAGGYRGTNVILPTVNQSYLGEEAGLDSDLEPALARNTISGIEFSIAVRPEPALETFLCAPLGFDGSVLHSRLYFVTPCSTQGVRDGEKGPRGFRVLER